MDHEFKASFKMVLAGLNITAVLVFCSTVRGQEAKIQTMMPAAQQTSVVQQYCGSCHSDALMYGGLSVEHFDAVDADPSLAAMLVSKLTNGHTPQDVSAATHGPDADAAILRLMKNSAMGAAGKGMPDETTQVAFGKALSAEAAGAEDWNTRWAETPRTLTAAILRELPSTKDACYTDMYRLILNCRIDTHQGEINLAWANGVPEEGRQIMVAVDGKAPVIYKVEGGKKQGNGTHGPGATVLYPSLETNLPFPTQSLSIGNLFSNETVVFPFDNLSQTVRQDLSTCFTNRTY